MCMTLQGVKVNKSDEFFEELKHNYKHKKHKHILTIIMRIMHELYLELS